MSITYPELRRRISRLVYERDNEWSGAPVPIAGLTLDIEPKNPYRDLATALEDKDAQREEVGVEIVNHWYSTRAFSDVWIYREDGKTKCARSPRHNYVRRLEFALKSFEASWAHDTEAEWRAIATLVSHIGEQKARYYLLLGQFPETSTRSGVTYLFRRARPTVAMRANEHGTRVLAALCLHPIGYYRETFVGAMTPTDDVLAHLLMMRGDEHLFWRRANQHAPDTPEAGI